MNNFTEFLTAIQDFKEKPVKLKQIKKQLKINEKSFPPYKNILNYYFQEFSKRTNEEHRTKWHRKDKILFVWTVLKYFELEKRHDLNPSDHDWQKLSKILGVSDQLLNLKWISMLKTNLKMAPWNGQEDEILQNLIGDSGENKNWTQITIDFNKINPLRTVRHAKQIRERWNNYLNPELRKCEWSQQEQIQLLELVKEIGKRWSLISKKVQGRTENQVKNQYNSMINSFRRHNVFDNEDIAINKLLADLKGLDYEIPEPPTTKRVRKQTLQQKNNLQQYKAQSDQNKNSSAKKLIEFNKNEIKPQQEISNQQPQLLQYNSYQQMMQDENQLIQCQSQYDQLRQVKEEQSIQDQNQLMMNLPMFSPLFNFQTPYQYMLCNYFNHQQLETSPNNMQSPFDITRQTNFSMYDEFFLKQQYREQTRDHHEVPMFLQMLSSPQGFQNQAYEFQRYPSCQNHQESLTGINSVNNFNNMEQNSKKIKKLQKTLLSSLQKEI